jgi:voltage-gated potassium channel
MQRLFERGSLPVLMLLALTVLALCGGGFWWLEPNAPTLADGLWLAFVTAATVGYGDIVPSTPASKIFAVFVVLLGWGVLTMATAAISSMWVESSERRLERDILQDLHREVGYLRQELATLRAEVRRSGLSGVTGQAAPPAPDTDAR